MNSKGGEVDTYRDATHLKNGVFIGAERLERFYSFIRNFLAVKSSKVHKPYEEKTSAPIGAWK